MRFCNHATTRNSFVTMNTPIPPGSAGDDRGAQEARFCLVGIGGWLDGQRFPIAGRSTIGRDTLCEITIPGNYLSRRHAELLPFGTSLKIRDLGSSNGTYVNGERVTEAALKHGDTLRLDVLRFRVEAPGAAARSPVEDANAKQPHELRRTAPRQESADSAPAPAPGARTAGSQDETAITPPLIWMVVALATLALLSVMILMMAQ